MELKSFCLLCDLYPQILEFLVGKTLKRYGIKKGIITKISKQSLIVDNGEFTILKEWLREDKGYEIDEIDSKGEISEYINKKYNQLILEERTKQGLINELEDKKIKYEDEYSPIYRKLSQFLKEEFIGVYQKDYKNNCWNSSCCSGRIDSEKSEFCIVCGWFKCSTCKSCGCGRTNVYGYNSELHKYKSFLDYNPHIDNRRKYIISLKMKIEELDEELEENYREHLLLSLELDKLKVTVNSINSLDRRENIE